MPRDDIFLVNSFFLKKVKAQERSMILDRTHTDDLALLSNYSVFSTVWRACAAAFGLRCLFTLLRRLSDSMARSFIKRRRRRISLFKEPAAFWQRPEAGSGRKKRFFSVLVCIVQVLYTI